MTKCTGNPQTCERCRLVARAIKEGMNGKRLEEYITYLEGPMDPRD